jgi:hypothetical protein
MLCLENSLPWISKSLIMRIDESRLLRNLGKITLNLRGILRDQRLDPVDKSVARVDIP